MKAFKKVMEVKESFNNYIDQMIEDLKEDGIDLEEMNCLDEDLGFMLHSALEDCEI